MIEQQINGDPALNFDPATGNVLAPLLLWGPYLWANGSTANSQGTTWLLGDFEADRVHPSASGEAKVGALLTQYFDSEASAGWLAPLAGSELQIVLPEADAYVDAAQPTSNFGGLSQLRALGGSSRKRVYLRFNVGSVATQLIHAKLVVRDENTGLNPVITLASNSNWDELSINNAKRPSRFCIAVRPRWAPG